MRILLALLVFVLPVLTHAFVAVETDISQPYEVFPVENVLPDQTSYLGTLDNYPVMYEVRSEEAFIFTAQLRQPASSPSEPLALLLIRRNDRGGGVTEIVRQNIDPADWSRERDSLVGMSFLTAEVLEIDVEPGIYRLEVSSPNNLAQYMLTVGDESIESGYFEQLGYARQTQSYFGYGFFTMLRSSLVYYPIGILLLLGAFYQTWRFASKRRSDA
ncbi:MAG: hypothetical protein ACI9SY_000778 [Candidatus Paceibacteria bacterium]|jgi:hypothetical protein